ncbi:MAG: VTC domain-containing protein [Candidatus Omnitrophica bacterium]|nr:VTC domain-containing protein [Candidatus Omnitrophota bacterium]
MVSEDILRPSVSKACYSRRELKYYISRFQYHEIMKIIKHYMEFDEYTARTPSHAYPVRSLYLDSKELRCYHERLDGLKVRAKYRARTYVEDASKEDTGLFMEIKKKIDKDLIKRRVRIRAADMGHILDGADELSIFGMKEMLPEEIKTVNDFLYAKTRYAFSFYLGIRYEREAYYDKASHGLRLSFDRGLHAKKCVRLPDLYAPLKNWKEIKQHGIIFEIKTRTSLPQWLEDLVSRHSMVAEPISKYCMGIEALDLHKR